MRLGYDIYECNTLLTTGQEAWRDWRQKPDCSCRRRYELHHGVRINDGALVEAAVMSDRYIADRFLPDKAIDLVDEAAAKLKMEITSKPVHLDEIDRKILQLEMERLSLTKARAAPLCGCALQACALAAMHAALLCAATLLCCYIEVALLALCQMYIMLPLHVQCEAQLRWHSWGKALDHTLERVKAQSKKA